MGDRGTVTGTAEKSKLTAQHAALKLTRFRGEENPPHAAVLRYLRELEREMGRIRNELDAAWSLLEDWRDYRKCSRHLDHSQQRLHRLIKKL
jgi:hypothetical protein